MGIIEVWQEEDDGEGAWINFNAKNICEDCFSVDIALFDSEDNKFGTTSLPKGMTKAIVRIHKSRGTLSLRQGFGSYQIIPGHYPGAFVKLSATPVGAMEDLEHFPHEEWTVPATKGVGGPASFGGHEVDGLRHGEVTGPIVSGAAPKEGTMCMIEVLTPAGESVFGPVECSVKQTIADLKRQVCAHVGHEVHGLRHGDKKLYDAETLKACQLGAKVELNLTKFSFHELTEACEKDLRDLAVLVELHGASCVRVHKNSTQCLKGGEGGSNEDSLEIVLTDDGNVLAKRSTYHGHRDGAGGWDAEFLYQIAEGSYTVVDPATCGVEINWTFFIERTDTEHKKDELSDEKRLRRGRWAASTTQIGAEATCFPFPGGSKASMLKTAIEWSPPDGEEEAHGFGVPISQEVLYSFDMNVGYMPFWCNDAPKKPRAVKSTLGPGLTGLGIATDCFASEIASLYPASTVVETSGETAKASRKPCHAKSSASLGGDGDGEGGDDGLDLGRSKTAPANFSSAYEAPRPKRSRADTGSRGAVAANIAAQFRMVDVNSSGTLDFNELYALMQRFDQKTWTKEKVNAMILAADVNKDGEVSYEEFIDWMFGIDTANEQAKKALAEIANTDAKYWFEVYRKDMEEDPTTGQQLFLFAQRRGGEVSMKASVAVVELDELSLARTATEKL